MLSCFVAHYILMKSMDLTDVPSQALYPYKIADVNRNKQLTNYPQTLQIIVM
jgi:hypothetical protein